MMYLWSDKVGWNVLESGTTVRVVGRIVRGRVWGPRRERSPGPHAATAQYRMEGFPVIRLIDKGSYNGLRTLSLSGCLPRSVHRSNTHMRTCALRCCCVASECLGLQPLCKPSRGSGKLHPTP